MCGIVGYISTSNTLLDVEKENFLTDALILDTFRGMDSTGLLTLYDEFSVSSHKALGEGWDFVASKEFLEIPNGWAAIGHNRAATQGKVTAANAHPFKAGPIMLVHNGTLSNGGKNLPHYSEKYDVDSIQIARAIASVAPEKAQEVLSMLDGAFALAWVDERDKSFNITRNSRRPLHFAANTADTILWFMSDADHLAMIKRRRWCMAADMGGIFSFGIHSHMKWKKGSIIPEVIKYPPFVVKSYHSPYQRGKTSYNYQNSAYKGAQNHSSTGFVPPAKQSIEKRELGVPLSHQIYLNGKVGKIPDALLQELDDVLEISPDDTLIFTPERFIAYPRRKGTDEYGYAEGEVFIPEWGCEISCVVHNLSIKHVDKICLPQWKVTPYGVSTQCRGEWGVMAKIKRFNIPPIKESAEPEEEHVAPAAFIGPFGRLLSYSEWRGLTSLGCSECSCDLAANEHDKVWWAGEMERSPICEDCIDKLTGGIVH